MKGAGILAPGRVASLLSVMWLITRRFAFVRRALLVIRFRPVN